MESLKYSDLVIDDGAIQKLISDLNNLRSVYEKDMQAILDFAKTLKSTISVAGGQTNLKQAGDEVDKLKKQFDELNNRYATGNLEIEKYKALIAELKQQMKANAKAALETSAATKQEQESYNALAAEYTRLKIELNKYSAAEIKNNKVLADKQARALQVMEAMKQMQAATGRHTLDVGNYSKALNGLGLATQQIVREMPSLAMSANQFFLAISNNIPVWQDAFDRYRDETKSTALAIQATIKSVFSMQTAIVLLLAVLSKYGAQIISFIKDTLKLGKAFDAAAEAAKRYAETMASIAGDMARSASDLQTYIYVLENGNKTEAEQADIVKLVNEQYAKQIDYLGLTIDSTASLMAAKEQLIAVLVKEAEARGVLNKIEEVSGQIAEREASEEYEKLREGVESAQRAYEAAKFLSGASASGSIGGYAGLGSAAQGSAEVGRAKTALSETTAELKKYNEETQVLINLRERLLKRSELLDFSTLLGGGTSRAGARGKEVKNRDLEFIRAAEDEELALQRDAMYKQTEAIRLEYTRRIEDLQTYLKEQRALNENEREITIAGEKAIESQITSLREGMYKAWLDLAIENLQAYGDEIAKVADDEMKALLKSQQDAIKAERDAQKKEEAAEKKRLTQREQAAKRIYDLRVSEIKLADFGDDEKEAADLLAAKIEYKENLLKVWQSDASKTIAEIKTLKNEIALLKKEAAKEDDSSWLDKIRTKLDETFGKGGSLKLLRAIKQATDYAMQQFQELLQARVELADAMVEQSERELEATKSALDQEIEARNNGYANNVALAQQEYLEKQRINEQALREQAEVNKQMEAFNTAQQVMSLITASATLFAALAPLGAIGVGVAIASIATMMAAFIAAKASASQAVNAKTYGEGGTELLSGGSHQSGRDIPLGTMPDGRERRAEGGEYLAIFNKRSSRKYGSVIPSVVDALNRGVFEAKYGNAFKGEGLVVNVESPIGAIEDFHRDMKKAMGRRSESVLADGTRIVVTGHTKKIIRS